MFPISFSLWGRARVHCPGNPPFPSPPPPQKKEIKGCSLCEPDRSKITYGSLVGRLQAKFWIFLLHFVYRLSHVVVKGLGINRVIQLFEINLFTPELPKTPCEESSNFFVLCTTSDVISVTDNLAFTCSGVNGLRWSLDFRYYVLGLRCVKYQIKLF